MDIRGYLQRINFNGALPVEANILAELHEHHVFHVPFENLDVHYKKPFDLHLGNVYRKVITNNRGGFCYELNSLFETLLREIGFETRIISSRIIDEAGVLGPEYDHMSICVDIEGKKLLADVGYGDLFLKPIEIKEGIHSDGRSLFKIELLGDDTFLLSMAADGITFQKKYQFSLTEVAIDKFHDICLDKQINPSSYFVKNLVCTKPTEIGRVTIWNDRLIERIGEVRNEQMIKNDIELRSILMDRFSIHITS